MADKRNDPVPGTRMWFKAEFAAQAKARTVGQQSGTVVRVTDDPLVWERRVWLEADDGTTFDALLPLLRFTAPRGLSQRRETVKEAKPKVRKEAIDPVLGDELTLEV